MLHWPLIASCPKDWDGLGIVLSVACGVSAGVYSGLIDDLGETQKFGHLFSLERRCLLHSNKARKRVPSPLLPILSPQSFSACNLILCGITWVKTN